jgi:hypothetical protein
LLPFLPQAFRAYGLPLLLYVDYHSLFFSSTPDALTTLEPDRRAHAKLILHWRAEAFQRRLDVLQSSLATSGFEFPALPECGLHPLVGLMVVSDNALGRVILELAFEVHGHRAEQ